MTTEIELKYLLFTEQNDTNISAINQSINTVLTANNLAFEFSEKQLTNSYYDTDALTLRQLDFGLRVRGKKLGGQDFCYEQTIKTAGKVVAGLHQRPEYNVDLSNANVDLALFPEHIWPQGTDVATIAKNLSSIFTTNFTRYNYVIELAAGKVELAFDCGDISCFNYEKTKQIFEIEFELLSGETSALFELARLMMSNIAMRPGQDSKAKRGYALAAEFAGATKVKKQANVEDLGTLAPQYLALDIIPMVNVDDIGQAFVCGINFGLKQLQANVARYVDKPSLTTLSKISENFALLRQGFWLFEQVLPANCEKIRDELSYYLRVIHWVDNAQHLKELMTKTGSYRKKLSHCQALIDKLKLEKRRYPDEQKMLALFHDERFNLLQLSLLELLVDEQALISRINLNAQPLLDFTQIKLTQSLQQLTDEVRSLAVNEQQSERYLGLYPLLIRSLLTGSWFASLYNYQVGDAQLSEQQLLYRRPWLDVKQGISELQTLDLLQQQLAILPVQQNKLELWLSNKVDNLLQALQQSVDNALSIQPYWHHV